MPAGDEGQLTLQIYVGEDQDDFNRYVEEKELLSRLPGQDDKLFWIMQLSNETRDEIVELYRSREMIRKYNQLSASSTLTDNEKGLLNDEKAEESRHKNKLREKMAESLYQSVGFFRGVRKESTNLGRNYIETIREFLNYAVPLLYTKLRLGARPLRGNEISEVLKAANLNALPQVFYGGDAGTDLIIERDGKYISNPEADIAKEVLGYIQRQTNYGNKVMGKDLESHFQGMPYGWEFEMILLVLAVMLRAGAVEVTHQSRRFRNHLDPQARTPFTSKTAFRSASFATRQPIDLRTLRDAVRHYEALTGLEVDVEELAISEAFTKLAGDEISALIPLEARLSANSLSVPETLDAYRATMETAQNSASEDVVRILAGEGKSIREMRDQIRQLQSVTDDKNLEILRWSRLVAQQMWPELLAHGDDLGSIQESANTLEDALNDSQFFTKLEPINAAADEVEDRYRQVYEDLHVRRGDAYQEIIEEISALDDWQQLSPDIRTREIGPLVRRADTDLNLPDGANTCLTCSATISQMESDLAAAAALRVQVLERIHSLVTPQERIQRVRVSDYISGGLNSPESIDEALAKLREHLLSLLDQGVRIVLE
jgi:hypothetical protein